jgi:hypothetical protein
MKTLFLALVVLASGITSAHAGNGNAAAGSQLEYSTTFELGTGEKKTLLIRVNPTLNVVSHGDAEIPSHGFYNYEVQGSVIENGTACPFTLLLFQENGAVRSTEAVLAAGIDRSGSLQTCSKLTLKLASLRALLNQTEGAISLYASGLNLPLAKSTLHFTRIYQEPVSSGNDPWHDY